MQRYTLKIGGASGTGINTVGLILARALKRSGYYNFAYREYPSLIKGGYASYQLDISDKQINSPFFKSNLIVAIDKASFDTLEKECSKGQIFTYDSTGIRVTEDQVNAIKEKGVDLRGIDLTKTAKNIGGNAIMKNTVLMGVIWKLFGLDQENLLTAIIDVFNKTQEIEDANKNCALAGFDLIETDTTLLHDKFEPKDDLSDHLSITGNEAIALGAAASGVRAYYAYPMTPSSTILSTMAKIAKPTGILVKQAEDEITAVNLTIGSAFAGTRAMTGTSGGGFDLMSETISLSGISEIPLVIALAQRPGPGTGLPTWTNQGDLKLAIHAAHGEFPRIVLAPSNTEECFSLSFEAQNLAEKYQVPVIILTDKYLAESLYTVAEYDQSDLRIERGSQTDKLDENSQRYNFDDSGISLRWNPGEEGHTYLANSDEHDEYGHSTEDLDLAKKMMEKRYQKLVTILEDLPDPEFIGEENADISIISWGSTKEIILDAINSDEELKSKVNVLHFSHVYPLKTEVLLDFADKSNYLVLVENNQTGQFGELVQSNTNIIFDEKVLRYDGRPFFADELRDEFLKILNK